MMMKSSFALMSLLAFGLHEYETSGSNKNNNRNIFFFVSGEESTQQQQQQRQRQTADNVTNTVVDICFGYIENQTNHNVWIKPEKISCTRETDNIYGNQWGPSVHQEKSCCTGNGRHVVQTSRIGGFDILPSLPLLPGTTIDGVVIESVPIWNEELWRRVLDKIDFDPVCQAYTSALQATLCDPKQGINVAIEKDERSNSRPNAPPFLANVNISNSPSMTPTESQAPSMTPSIDPNPVLRICRRSCDMVFDVCGLPGANFPEDAGYSDGESLCYKAWGGWYNSHPCDTKEDGFPCQRNLEIFVENSNLLCLDIAEPTQREIDSYIRYRKPPVPEECVPPEPVNTGIIIGAIIGAACFFFMLGGCIWIYIRRRQMDVEDVGELY